MHTEPSSNSEHSTLQALLSSPNRPRNNSILMYLMVRHLKTRGLHMQVSCEPSGRSMFVCHIGKSGKPPIGVGKNSHIYTAVFDAAAMALKVLEQKR